MRAGRRRAAPDAGPKRHLPRLDPRCRRGRGGSRLLRAPAAGTEKFSCPIEQMIRGRNDRSYARVCGLDPGPRARPLRRPRSELAAYLGGSHQIRRRPSPSSPKPTAIRTTATTPHSKPPVKGRQRAKTTEPTLEDREVMAAANPIAGGPAPTSSIRPRDRVGTAGRSMNAEDHRSTAATPRPTPSRWSRP